MAEPRGATADLTPVYLAVGRGITSFAGVEHALADLFSVMMAPAPTDRALAAMQSIRSFDGKFGAVDAVADAALSGPLRDQWVALRGDIKQLQAVRNKLAHWMVMYRPDGGSPALTSPVAGDKWYSAEWDADGVENNKPIDLPDIARQTDAMVTMIERLEHFAVAVRKQG